MTRKGVEILKKIQDDCSEYDRCKDCGFYSGNVGCKLHSSPIEWELDSLEENIAKENEQVYSFDLQTFVIYSILGVSFTALGFVSSILYRRL